MKRNVLLGAPSSTGKGAKQLIAEAFAAAVFPLVVTLENKVARAFSLPEVGVFLEPCTHSGHYQTVPIKDFDALQRLGSTIEQLGFLNNIQGLIAVEADVSEGGNADPETWIGEIDPANGQAGDSDPNAGTGEGGDADPNAGGDNPNAAGGEANGQDQAGGKQSASGQKTNAANQGGAKSKTNKR
jgi:hypothetical protein